MKDAMKDYAILYYERKRRYFRIDPRKFHGHERLNGFPPREQVYSYHPDAIARYIRVAEKRRRLWWNVSNNAGRKWAKLLGRP